MQLIEMKDVQMLSNKKEGALVVVGHDCIEKVPKDLKTTKAKVNAILDAVVLNVCRKVVLMTSASLASKCTVGEK